MRDAVLCISGRPIVNSNKERLVKAIDTSEMSGVKMMLVRMPRPPISDTHGLRTRKTYGKKPYDSVVISVNA